ncbi:LOW QUALITY PROTEIN: mitochondrial protein C2orf69 homolog [Xyrauchen texanus]|uniref:LOW QUALITY PROTEIN: mitochondrial protein C2orf69 homolog n=1 Tax=Xyrauchen texanus TaxID=154827 RepID=UPI0022420B73|nr:LOW QUALITY PROTEIN: mitochondrial protein C2orf69 homolog [Xyrauchen texanus]
MLQIVLSPLHNILLMGTIRSVIACLSPAALARKMNNAALCVPGTSCVRAPGLLRLTSVPGYDKNRVNDVLLLTPLTRTQKECDNETENLRNVNAHVVFFPGDIQNFQQEMALQPDAAPWQSWSLERVALTLGHRFPGCHIWVVRASCMYLHKFSCYQNFVESNLFGAPEHSPDYGAIRHLRALLGHSMVQAGLPNPLPPLSDTSTPAPLPSGFTLTLVGFSKGCVVLNQIVYELAGAQADPELRLFLDSVSDMYWLDGGHPGGNETWVTDKCALGVLASSGMAVHAHVTPYEVSDPLRAWVGREHGHFIKTLEGLGACLSQKVHFEDEPASIENHFRVIQDF